MVVNKQISFHEVIGGSGIYRAAITVPAFATVLKVVSWGVVGWQDSSNNVSLEVGDEVSPTEYGSTSNLGTNDVYDFTPNNPTFKVVEREITATLTAPNHDGTTGITVLEVIYATPDESVNSVQD